MLEYTKITNIILVLKKDDKTGWWYIVAQTNAQILYTWDEDVKKRADTRHPLQDRMWAPFKTRAHARIEAIKVSNLHSTPEIPVIIEGDG